MRDEKVRKSISEDVDRLAEIIGGLTTNQIRFIVARYGTGTDKGAAESIQISPSTVSNWKYDGVPIDEAVCLMSLDGIVVAKEILRRNLAKAAAVKVAGLDSNDERIRQGTSSEILDRELGRAVQPTQITGAEGRELTIVIRERQRD